MWAHRRGEPSVSVAYRDEFRWGQEFDGISSLLCDNSTWNIPIIVNLILKRLGISQIIGYIMTGVVVAYAFDLRHMADSHAFESIAEFGSSFDVYYRT